MSKFKVLECNHKFMVWLGIHSYRLTEPTNEFLHAISSYCVFFSVFMFTIISSAVFAYKNFSLQFDAALEAVFIVIAGLQASGMFISVGVEMKAVKTLHLKLQEIVHESRWMYLLILFKINYFLSLLSRWKRWNSRTILVYRAKMSKIHKNDGIHLFGIYRRNFCDFVHLLGLLYEHRTFWTIWIRIALLRGRSIWYKHYIWMVFATGYAVCHVFQLFDVRALDDVILFVLLPLHNSHLWPFCIVV